MNICFYTAYEVNPTKGGTERITHTIAKNLTKLYGWKCYSIFSEEAVVKDSIEGFEDSFKIAKPAMEREKLSAVLRKWNIDIFINQGSFHLSDAFEASVHELGGKYVFCHHFEPGWELNFISFKKMYKKYKKEPSIVNLIKACIYPYYKLRQRYDLPRLYNLTYRKADKVVLLSSLFIPQFIQYGKIKDKAKFGTIHNSLSFDSFYDESQLGRKEKMVLIVSRMEDTQKKISMALEIWKEIEKRGHFHDWSLHLVGSGDDLEMYKRYVKKHGLAQVEFEGRHPSEDFYRRASLFMMTSKSEGWGLTLTEAQQNGCVPIAFDTYASLHNIIISEYNGVIIPKGNLKSYRICMEKLMSDDELRKKMAVTAIRSSHRFEQIEIVKQWHKLLSSIKEQK